VILFEFVIIIFIYLIFIINYYNANIDFLTFLIISNNLMALIYFYSYYHSTIFHPISITIFLYHSI